MLLLRFIALALIARCMRAQFPSGKGVCPLYLGKIALLLYFVARLAEDMKLLHA